MINFDVLNKYMENDVDLIVTVFSTYLEDHANDIQRINELYANKCWPELYLLAHSLKGILESFAEETAVIVFTKIEAETRNDNEPDSSDIAIVTKELAAINQQIFAYLENMQ
ncbi:TPA: Hpt domain-containing protein [Vibrio diabolicus]